MTLTEWKQKYDPRQKKTETTSEMESSGGAEKLSLTEWRQKYVLPAIKPAVSPAKQLGGIQTRTEKVVDRMESKLRPTASPVMQSEPLISPLQSVSTGGKYYSKPENLWSGAAQMEQRITQTEGNLKVLQRQAQDLAAAWQNSQSDTAYQMWQDVYNRYETEYDAYTRYYDEYDSYRTEQQRLYDDWRGTVRSAEDVSAEIAEVQKMLDTAKSEKRDNYLTTPMNELPQYDARIKQYEDQLAMLEEEYDWARYFAYDALRSSEDFEKLSKYKRTGETAKKNWRGDIETVGYGDVEYEIINRNEKARQWQAVKDIKYGAAFAGVDQRERSQMTDDEIAIFNYLYAQDEARGDKNHTSAYEYVDYITTDLTYRQQLKDAEWWSTYAKENPVRSSVFSAVISPLKAVTAVGQAADYLEDGKIDENAGYNKFSHIPSDIRGAVSESVEEKWGKVGSFAYNTGMSMADFLVNTALSGGNSALAMTLMGSEVAADTVIDGKKRGLSDDQAFTLGIVAGLAEAVTEKFSVDALLDATKLGKSAFGYWMKNTITEASEEGASNLINTFADIMISKDKSEWKKAIDAYKAQGLSEEDAFYKALGDQAASIGLDMLGGAISGATMAAPGVAVHGASKVANAIIDKRQNIDKPSEDSPIRAEKWFEPEVAEDGTYEDQDGNRVLTDGTKIEQDGTKVLSTADTREQGKRMEKAKTVTARTGVATGATDGQIKTAERLSKILGKEIRFFRQDAAADGSIENGLYRAENDVILVNAASEKGVRWVVAHELTHSTELSAEYDVLNKFVISQMQELGVDVDAMVKQRQTLYAEHGVTLTDPEAKLEVVADFAADYLLTDEKTIRALVKGHPTVAQRILEWADGILAKNGNEDAELRVMLQKARGMYAGALSDANKVRKGISEKEPVKKLAEDTAQDLAKGEDVDYDALDEERSRVGESMLEDDGRYAEDGGVIDEEAFAGQVREHFPDAQWSIEKLPDGKKYVRADRQVIFGNDPYSWSEQLEDYINGKIRRGQDVRLLAEDGDVLTLTADTAGKISSMHGSDGKTLSDTEFERKVNAGTHIDELAQVSRKGRTKPDYDARHGAFASRGWNYRTAYFQDFDGKYYRVRLSVAQGENGNVVYNVGEMEERSFPAVNGSSVKDGALDRKTSSEDSISQTAPAVKEKLSVTRSAKEQDSIMANLRSILQNGGTAADLRSYVDTLDAQERAQAKKKPQGTNTQRRADAASQIVRAAHNADMTVEEYLRENAELYETEDGWNREARRALEMEENGRGSKYSISPTLKNDLQKVLDGKFSSKNNEVYIGESSTFLTDTLKAKSLKVTMPAKKAYAAMVTKDEALKENRYDPKLHYHGLGVKGLYDALVSSEDPVAAFAGTEDEKGNNRDDHIVLVTDKMGEDGNLVAVMEVDTEGYVDGHRIKVNKTITSYGRSSIAEDIYEAAQQGRLLHLDKKRSQSLFAGVPGSTSPGAIRSVDFANSIRHFWENVKWKKSGQKTFSAEPPGEQKTGMAYAFEQAQKKAAEKGQRSITSPETAQIPMLAKRDFRNRLISLMSIPDGAKQKIGDAIEYYGEELIAKGRLEEGERRSFFNLLYSSGAMTLMADEYYREIRSAVAKKRIYVSESVKSEFGEDWNDFRKKAFAAGVYLTNSRSDAGADVWNKELSEMFPGSFSEEDTDLRDILERIVEFAEKGKGENVSLSEYAARLADENFISEEEYLSGLERRFEEELRLFAEKAGLEITLKEKHAKEKQKEMRKRREMLEEQRWNKAVQERQRETLKTLKWLRSHRHLASEDLREAFDEVLSDIDTYAIGAINEKAYQKHYGESWRDFVQSYKDAKESDPNWMPSAELDKLVERVDNRKIEDMDIDALQDLYRAATALRTEFYNRRNMLGEMNYQLFSDVYLEAKEDIKNANKGYTGKALDKFFNVEQLSVMNVLRRMAGWNPESMLYKMAQQLEAGEWAVQKYVYESTAQLSDFLKKHEDWARRADGQGKDGIWIQVKVPRLLAMRVGEKPQYGGTVDLWMTPAQRVYMYLESKSVENLRHMAGGRTFADKELYSQGKRSEAFAKGETVRLSPETVKAIVSEMTPEERELAGLLEKYFNGYAKNEINRVSNILYGYDKAMSRYYAPIYTDQNYTQSEPGIYDATAEGAGNLKARQHAKNPSYQIGAFDAFERHVDKTAKFVGLAIPIRNWNTLLNWREKDNSMKAVISGQWGLEGKRFIEDTLTRLQSATTVEADIVSTGVDKWLSNYIGAIFGANPSIVAKQFGSVAMAIPELGARNAPTPKQIKNIDRDLIAKYTSVLAWRGMGYATPETKQLKENPNWTQRNKVMRFTFGGGAITAADQAAASVLWPWAENKVRREHPELVKGTKAEIDAGESAFYKKVAEEFNAAVANSQSVSDEMHQSKLRKSKNLATRALTMFKSDSAQAYNQLRRAIGEAQYYKRTGASEDVQKKANRKVGDVVVGMLANNAWAAVVSFLIALWKNKGKKYRDDEDELTVSSVVSQMAEDLFLGMSGVVIGAEEFADFIGNVLTGDKWYGIDVPGMDVVEDMGDLLYDTGRGAIEFLQGGLNVLKDDGDIGKYIAQNAGTIIGGIKDIASSIAMYFGGIPVSNVEAYLMGMVSWVSPRIATAYEDLLDSPGKTDLASLKGKALDQRVDDIMRDRDVKLTKDGVEMLAALYDAGHKSAVPSDVPTSITIDGETHELTETQKQKYSEAWAKNVSAQLQKVLDSKEFKTADLEEKGFMVSKVYQYGAEFAKNEVFKEYEPSKWVGEVKRFSDAGMNMPKYLGVQAAYSGIYESKADGKIKALDFAKWVTEQGFTKEQQNVIRECFGNSAETYYNFVDAGVTEYNAYRTAKAIAELKPTDGRESIVSVQKYRAVIDEQLPASQELLALSQVMTDSDYAKVQAGNAHGITPGVFVTFKELLPRFDEDGNGSFSQEEVERAIDSIGSRFGHVLPSYGSANAKNTNLTNAQRAVLWQLANKSWKPESNPYSEYAGRKVYNDLNN